jgi:hypothetical protein
MWGALESWQGVVWWPQKELCFECLLKKIESRYIMCMYENRIKKPTKNCKKEKKGEESNERGEYDRSIWFACMELSQNTFCINNIC